jgi:hypothetical protein
LQGVTPIEPSFQGVLTVAPEQQPCGVQVVEWVGLDAIVEVYAFHHSYLLIKWRFDK